jgi:hypothetical protein
MRNYLGFGLVLVGALAFGAQCSPVPAPSRNALAHNIQGEKEYTLVFDDPPAFVLSLPIAPNGLNEKLKQGKWLVLVYSINSVPDVRCIDAALRTVLPLEGKIGLAVQPAKEFISETSTWLPEINDFSGSPAWVFLNQGKIASIHIGELNTDQISSLLEQELER